MSGSQLAIESNTLADGRQKDRIENYTKFWQKDTSNESEVDNENRLENYTDVVNGMHSPQTISFSKLFNTC